MLPRLGIDRSLVTGMIAGGMVLACLALGTTGHAQVAPPAELPDDPAAVIAVVGQSPILLGELLPKVEAKIAEVVEKAGQPIPEEQKKIAQTNMVRGLLVQAISNKMLRESFLLDQVGTQSADKRAEADAKLTSKARMMFVESELPELMKQYETTSRSELDRLLRKKGTSLPSRQREFVDTMLGHLYIRSKVDREPNVSIAEINERYQTTLDDYRRPARARWEQLTVLFERFPDRQSAQEAIWEMGRETFFGGNMQAVAREKSQEPYAREGGLHDWTSRGALASRILEDQIFSIPMNKLSEVIEDANGFHIIRVVGREEAGIVPLSEVQDELRTAIRKEKIEESQRSVMEAMHQRIPVWSLYHQDTEHAMPLPTPRVARLP